MQDSWGIGKTLYLVRDCMLGPQWQNNMETLTLEAKGVSQIT